MLSNISRLLVQCSTRRLTNFSKVEPFTKSRTLAFTSSIRSIQATSIYSQQQDSRIVDGLSHEELQQKLQDKDIYLVDVRRSEEVSEGRIPGDKWVHIPWQDVEEATTLNADEFLTKYGS